MQWLNIVTDELIQQIKSGLPDATADQVKRFAVQVARLRSLQNFFEQYPQDNGAIFRDRLDHAQKSLDFSRPYRIAMIGMTGAGKSTMSNALLGRPLLLTKDLGGPATGTALQIFLDVPEGGQETARVQYRTEADIRKLILDYFITPYDLDATLLNEPFSSQFLQIIAAIEPVNAMAEENYNDFKNLRATIVDLVGQHLRHASNQPLEDQIYSLDQQRDCDLLWDLVNENSDFNRPESATRKVGLVKCVTYHIRPAMLNQVQTLNLPENVCLVDLPGIDGSMLHNIIIGEGIEDADAVILILRPRQLATLTVQRLLNRIRKHISLEGNVDSGDRIFLVINAKDEIMSDKARSQHEIQEMNRIMEALVPGYTHRFAKRGGNDPYFMTSAWSALEAQRLMQGKVLDNPDTYKTVTMRLNVQGQSPQVVLEASQVPHLVDELMRFTREHRIEGKVRDGGQAIDSVVNTLMQTFLGQTQKLQEDLGIHQTRDGINNVLRDRQREVERRVEAFRKSIMQNFERIHETLSAEAQTLCAEIDQLLQQRMPDLWRKYSVEDYNLISQEEEGGQLLLTILSSTELSLWKHLSRRLPSLAETIVQIYQDQWQAQQLAQEVSVGCFHQLEREAMDHLCQSWLEQNMRPTLRTIASRIALTQITNPQTLFSRNGEDNSLRQLLGQLPPQPELPMESFSGFIAEVRRYYEPCILKYCIPSLINLFLYEMVLMEEHLKGQISRVFAELYYLDDATLQSKLLGSSNPDWERLSLLTHKFSILKGLTMESLNQSLQTNGRVEPQVSLTSVL